MDSERLSMVSRRQNAQTPTGADQFLKLVQDPFAVSVSATAGLVHGKERGADGT